MLINDILCRISKWLGEDTDAAVARALSVSPQTVNNWRNRGTIPWDNLYSFATKNALSLDWLIDGAKPSTKDHPCAGLEEHCPKFKNIMFSGHRVIKPAFMANLEAFHYSIEKEKSEEKDRLEMNERIKELEKAIRAGRNTDTDAVASSNIGKLGT